MALIKCENCGQMVSDKASKCPKCGCPIVKRPVVVTPTPTPTPTPKVEKPIAPAQQAPAQSSSHIKAIIITVCIVLLLVCGGVGGYFYYNNIYLPQKIDKEAPRYYTFGNVMLRSSQIAGVDYNKITMLSYGTRLITYSHGAEWSKVKVENVDPDATALEGYVSSPFILDEKDFFLLNSIFTDTNSRDAIPTAKCKLALLDYYKDHNYIGNLSSSTIEELVFIISPSSDIQWQVSVNKDGNKPYELFFKRLVNKNSKFTDFAVIIKNIKNGERKLLYFYFNDDETPHFYSEQSAPSTGDIKNISINDWGDLSVDYTDNDYYPY